jgi:predicted TPR repeat methyltransferase
MTNSFEQKYQQNPDPWNFATSDYELSRYAETIASLAGRRFEHALEPGCSIGVLTEQLAGICNQVNAMDISETAVKEARYRCASLKNVTVTYASISDFAPTETYDLIVLSEIGYYFDPPELSIIAARLTNHLALEGLLLAVHWLGYSEDHRLSGDEVHDILSEVPGLTTIYSNRYPGFLLEQWTKA